MRSESEMLTLITETAENDPRIRAAYLEGSRCNPAVLKDMFQDYDVVYIVNETESFQNDRDWINLFGKRLYMQYPEDGVYSDNDKSKSYGWLMQFTDGNRLDLHVSTPDYAKEHLELYRILLDKDGILPPPSYSSDEIYWIRRPDSEEFQCTCNEFWWCLNNAAKGLWRKELPYVLDSIDFHIRPMLKRLLEWKIGAENHFSVSAGKSGKYMMKYLTPGTYQRFLSTYTAASVEEIWDGIFKMCDLFDETAEEISWKLDLHYNTEEAASSRQYLNDIHILPADAHTIY